jgi:hypothetical protein
MTDSLFPSRGEGGCPQVAPELVVGYARGELGTAAAWSVEVHLPACAACRTVLGAEADQLRLARNRSVLLARLALPAPGPAEGLAAWCGIPPHVWRLLSVTPSLRRSWMAGIGLVLAVAVGAAYLIPAMGGLGAAGAGGPGPHPAGGPAVGLLPFLLLAPLLPLAGVAAAFHRRLDPAADLATAAPVSGIWLFCIRSVAVIAGALVPVVLATFVLPDSGWLPLLVVLPALAVSATALALATLTGPLAASMSAGAGWAAVAAGLSLAVGSPASAYNGTAQVTSLAVIVGASCLLFARRHALDLGWSR